MMTGLALQPFRTDRDIPAFALVVYINKLKLELLQVAL